MAENPVARARFLREARAAAQLHHPNVARVTYYGEQDGECFYVMEFIEGETLEERVRRKGPMPLGAGSRSHPAGVPRSGCGRGLRGGPPGHQTLQPDDCFAAGRSGTRAIHSSLR